MKEAFFYNDYFASVKDFESEIDVSSYKWNSLFDRLMRTFDAVYFQGRRKNFHDPDIQDSIKVISEKIFDADSQYNKLLVKLRTSSLLISRNYVSKLWEYYEFPKLIFLGDINDEDLLIKNCIINEYNEFTIDNVEDVIMVYTLYEPQVLWVEGNVKLEYFLAEITT